MNLRSAASPSDWEFASAIYASVRQELRKQNIVLWDQRATSVEKMQEKFAFDELYFVEEDEARVGVVFLQEEDPDIWPEVNSGDSLFFHRFAILPELWGKNYGAGVIKLLISEASNRGKKWIRIDCDDRQKLHAFYRGAGFQFVDMTKFGPYTIGRYQIEIT